MGLFGLGLTKEEKKFRTTCKEQAKIWNEYFKTGKVTIDNVTTLVSPVDPAVINLVGKKYRDRFIVLRSVEQGSCGFHGDYEQISINVDNFLRTDELLGIIKNFKFDDSCVKEINYVKGHLDKYRYSDRDHYDVIESKIDCGKVEKYMEAAKRFINNYATASYTSEDFKDLYIDYHRCYVNGKYSDNGFGYFDDKEALLSINGKLPDEVVKMANESKESLDVFSKNADVYIYDKKLTSQVENDNNSLKSQCKELNAQSEKQYQDQQIALKIEAENRTHAEEVKLAEDRLNSINEMREKNGLEKIKTDEELKGITCNTKDGKVLSVYEVLKDSKQNNKDTGKE
jgi:hypothetical protein